MSVTIHYLTRWYGDLFLLAKYFFCPQIKLSGGLFMCIISPLVKVCFLTISIIFLHMIYCLTGHRSNICTILKYIKSTKQQMSLTLTPLNNSNCYDGLRIWSKNTMTTLQSTLYTHGHTNVHARTSKQSLPFP